MKIMTNYHHWKTSKCNSLLVEKISDNLASIFQSRDH